MDREIEFRGKTKDNEWIYGYYHKETSTSLALQEYGIGKIDTHYIHAVINHLLFKVEVVGETIGQYTGLKDREENDETESPCLSDGKEIINDKCGHSVLYKCYTDCDKCMLCDLSMIEKGLI